MKKRTSGQSVQTGMKYSGVHSYTDTQYTTNVSVLLQQVHVDWRLGCTLDSFKLQHMQINTILVWEKSKRRWFQAWSQMQALTDLVLHCKSSSRTVACLISIQELLADLSAVAAAVATIISHTVVCMRALRNDNASNLLYLRKELKALHCLH